MRAPPWAWALAAGVEAGIALRAPAGLDYDNDAQTPIDALARGDVATFFHTQPLMGSVSLALRAPVVALAHAFGSGTLLEYRLGALLCLLPAGWLAVELGWWTWARGAAPAAALLAGGVVAVNPLTFNSLSTGHPEEALAAVLCIVAVLAALADRSVAAVVALGLAVGTKQWAVVAVGPTFLALAPGGRLPAMAGVAGLAAATALPLAVGDPDRFHAVARMIADTGRAVLPFCAWWPLARTHGALPAEVGRLAHPAIALLPLAVAALVAPAARRAALPLLAFALLQRCVLDPVDNPYYQVPLLLALATWEVVERRRPPVAAIGASLGMWALHGLLWRTHRHDDLVCALYLGGAAVLLVLVALGVRREVRLSAS